MRRRRPHLLQQQEGAGCDPFLPGALRARARTFRRDHAAAILRQRVGAGQGPASPRLPARARRRCPQRAACTGCLESPFGRGSDCGARRSDPI
eukprot:4165300-Prymnesium_polylepis.1